MCLSCHLGDASHGKLVTHEMYAAGHPPLPSFEIEAFSRMMPAHWRDLTGVPNAKPSTIAAEFLERTNEPYFRGLREKEPALMAAVAKGDERLMLRTRSLAVGALVAWSENAKLTHALLSDSPHPLLAEKQWPDFAQFECYACHHELQSPGWRRERTVGSAPGRPLLRDWASPLCLAVIKALSPEEEAGFRGDLEAITAAATVQPYGDRASLEPALAAAIERIAKLAETLEARPYHEADAMALLRSIAEVGSQELLEYDSARSLVWATTEVLEELDPAKELSLARERLAALRAPLVLDLVSERVRRKASFELPGAGQRFAYEIELSQLLPAMSEYSASATRAAFAEFAKALAESSRP
jgi:hypothetical protein